MDILLKKNENDAQIISHEDIVNHNSRGIYLRDDHCDWGSSGINDLAETLSDSK